MSSASGSIRASPPRSSPTTAPRWTRSSSSWTTRWICACPAVRSTSTSRSGPGPSWLRSSAARGWDRATSSASTCAGADRERAGERIGRYGQGGKAAVGHLGARFAIVAGRAGDDRAYGFSDQDYRDRSRLRTYELQERPKPVDVALGYVRIEVGAVDRNPDARKLRQRLTETYRPLLEAGEVVIRVDRGPVVPAAWQLDERREVAVRAGGRIVRGWYGLLPDPPPPGTEAEEYVAASRLRFFDEGGGLLDDGALGAERR